MTGDDFATLVDYIDDRWGKTEGWANAHNVTQDFAPLESDDVWVALVAWADNPEKAEWPPKPAQLRALALDRLRERERYERPGLPETTERWTWAEYAQRVYGEVIGFDEAIRRRAAELEEARR